MVGVLAQKAEAVRRYIEETGLPFDILIDGQREVAKAYGVWHRAGIDAWNIARPAVFLIDRAGIVRFAFVASWQTEYPTEEAVSAAIDALPQAERRV